MTVETDMLAQMRGRQSLRSGPDAKAVEVWLRKSLGERFDETLAETVPGDLASLVSRFAQ
jgi:hypothetical protein